MAEADALVDGLFRREAGKLAAWLARLVGPSHLALVEDAVQDAFGAALARWPLDGVPQNPAGWLAVAARNKAMDRLKREAKSIAFDENAAWRLGFASPEEIGRMDDTLALMFVACHPSLSPEEQTMLTLRTVCGFGIADIARAYLSTNDAVEQRLVRAKRQIKALNLRFEIPDGPDLKERLPALIDAIYLLFNGGYTAGEGETLIMQELCVEALRLARLLTRHAATATPEAHALTALIAFQHARAAARTTASGDLVLLADQDRSRWDRGLIGEGAVHLREAMKADAMTAIHAEAGIASVHAFASSFEQTDWRSLSGFYAILEEIKPTPVVKLNAAIAAGYANGPNEGLARLEALADQKRLRGYALYHSAHGDFLQKLKEPAAAREAFAQALNLTNNAAERAFLNRRIEDCG